MVKIKWLLISAAVVAAFAGAFAANEQLPCESLPQYFKWGDNYYPAGTYGTNYVCTNGPGNCTWYKPNPYDPNSFAPCRTGTFQFVFLNK